MSGYTPDRPDTGGPRTWQRTVTAHLDDDDHYHESWTDWSQVSPTVPLGGRIASAVGFLVGIAALVYILALVLATSWCQPT